MKVTSIALSMLYLASSNVSAAHDNEKIGIRGGQEEHSPAVGSSMESPKTPASTEAAAAAAAAKKHPSLNAMKHTKQVQGDISRRVIVKYASGRKNDCKRSMVLAERKRSSENSPKMQVIYEFDELDSLVVTADPLVIDALAANPEVDSVEDDPLRYPFTERRTRSQGQDRLVDSVGSNSSNNNSTVEDTASSPRRLAESIPYGVNLVQAPDVWALGSTGEGVKVCVIDSGIDQDHPDFDTSNLSGATTNKPWSEDGCGHGTHVSGTIAGKDNEKGVVGVAPDANIVTVRIFDDNCSYSYASAIYEAARLCKAQGAKIINMSLGGGTRSSVEEQAFDNLFNNDGILSIAAAGNGGNTRLSYPASYSSVVSVAAVNRFKKRTSFSQRNSQVDIAAPGKKVYSTFPVGGCQICGFTSRNGYGSIDGTSMATPHVAGVAALLLSANPGTSAYKLRQAIQNSAEDLGANGRDDSYGYGLVRAKDALDYLNNGFSGGPPPSPPPIVNCRGFPENWNDSDGSLYTCDWYAQGTNCAQYGNEFENDRYTANEACCECGGGVSDDDDTVVPTSRPTLPPTSRPTPSPTNAPTTPDPTNKEEDGICLDSPNNWNDSDGRRYNCEWYSKFSRCQDYGSGFSNEGYTANEACCECGGGNLVASPREKTTEEDCSESPRNWFDSDGAIYNCEWYALQDRCKEFGNGFQNFDATANQACCTCGGGKHN